MSARRDMKPRRGQRGETLVETLVAIVICTFASIVLVTAIVSSASVNRSAKTRDDALKNQETAASTLSESTTAGGKAAGTVTFTANGSSSSYSVNYSSGDDIVSYIDANLS